MKVSQKIFYLIMKKKALTVIQIMYIEIMKLDNFRGGFTDISTETKSLWITDSE